MMWYPGVAAVRRRKEAYIKNNPQIRAMSGPTTAEGTSSNRGLIQLLPPSFLDKLTKFKLDQVKPINVGCGGDKEG